MKIDQNRINPDWMRTIQQATNPCPYFQLQSMEIVDIQWGKSQIMIDIQEKHLQPFGLVHGGVHAGLIDAAGFWAVFSQLDSTLGMTTIELKLNYLSPVDSGRLFGYGRCIKLGKTLGLADARIEDDSGRLLAHDSTTVMVLPEPTLQDYYAFPAKYLED